MSELRKPCFIFLLKNVGKKTKKLELFESKLWDDKQLLRHKGYRLRVNGKWFPKGEIRFFTKWEVRDLIFRSVHF